MCTDFLLKTKLTAKKKRSFVNGRSMEFGFDLRSRPFVRARGDVMQSRTPDKTNVRNGLKWAVKYGYVGMDAFGLAQVVDGLNERGLSVGTLWLPGSEYQKVTDSSRALGVLLVNDSEQSLPSLSPTLIMGLGVGEGLDIGCDRKQHVTTGYGGTGICAYPGNIVDVCIEPGPQAPDSYANRPERLAQRD